MASARSVESFLKQHGVAYTLLSHPPAYTAQEEAAATHISGRQWAKTVVCLADGEPILAVLPAHFAVSVNQLRDLVQAKALRLAHEDELAQLYPECEVGAMPPLGPLYNQRVFVDEHLAGEPEIAFHAGTHTDAIRIRWEDFVALAKPTLGRFGKPIEH